MVLTEVSRKWTQPEQSQENQDTTAEGRKSRAKEGHAGPYHGVSIPHIFPLSQPGHNVASEASHLGASRQGSKKSISVAI